MPIYRTTMGTVHMKGRNLPKPCEASLWADGKTVPCADISGYLCDWREESGKTCDRALCQAHAKAIAKNRHYCPEHHQKHLTAEPQMGLFSGLMDASGT